MVCVVRLHCLGYHFTLVHVVGTTATPCPPLKPGDDASDAKFVSLQQLSNDFQDNVENTRTGTPITRYYVPELLDVIQRALIRVKTRNTQYKL